MVSIRDLILDDLVAVIGAVAPFNVAGAVQKIDSFRPDLDGNKFSVMPMVIVGATGETKENTPAGRYTCRLAVKLWVFDQKPISDSRSDNEIMFAHVTVIERAVVADRTRGIAGVSDTVLEGFDHLPQDENRRIAAEYNLTVIYQHDELDPETF